jgi:outer membrane protein assembly factor BamB
MNLKGWIVYGCFMVVLFDLILWKNPKLFSKELLFEAKPRVEFYLWNPIQFADFSMEKAGEKRIFYRNDITRSAVQSLEWPRDVEELWKTEKINVGIHGASKASPVSDETGIYIGTDTSWFYAYDPDGRLRWKFYAGDSFRGIHSTAALDEAYVYFGSYRGTFYCLDKKTGELIWSRRLGDTIGSSPLLFEDSLIVAVETGGPANGFVSRIKRATGETVWNSLFIGQQSHASPAIDLKSRMVMVGANNSRFFGIDLDTGFIRWSFPLSGESKMTPVVKDGYAYVTSWGKDFYKVSTEDGRVEWRAEIQAKSQVSPVIVGSGLDEKVIAGDAEGNLYAFSTIDGRRLWKQNMKVAPMTASPVVLRWKNQDGILNVCDKDQLCLLDSKTGSRVRQLRVGGSLTGVPSFFEDKMYIAFNEGPLKAFRLRLEKR